MAALAGAQLLVALDFSIIYVALPDIGASLNFSAAALQWVVSAYAILFAGFLLLGGQLVDAYGGGRVFGTGLLLFAAASVVAALAGTATLLIAGRVGQGVAAALLVPATLGLLNSAYPPGPARNRALSVWGTSGAVGLALGVTAGGVILTVGSWPGIFWINLPIVASCLTAAGPAVLRGSGRPGRRPAVGGALLASATVASVVLVCTELARPDPAAAVLVGSAAAALIAGLLFVRTQRRSPRPLVRPALLRVRTLQLACIAAALYMASFGAEFFLVTLFLQDVRGYTALSAGLAFLPLAGTIVAGNTVSGMLAGRWSLRRLLAVAYGVGAAGLLVLALAAGHSVGYAAGILPGLLLSGLGQGMAFTGTFITGTRELPEESNGVGSALITTAQYTGGAVGLAVLVLVLGGRPSASAFGVTFVVAAALAFLVAPLAGKRLKPS